MKSRALKELEKQFSNKNTVPELQDWAHIKRPIGSGTRFKAEEKSRGKVMLTKAHLNLSKLFRNRRADQLREAQEQEMCGCVT